MHFRLKRKGKNCLLDCLKALCWMRLNKHKQTSQTRRHQWALHHWPPHHWQGGSSFLTGTWKYPSFKSNFVKYFIPCSDLIKSVVFGKSKPSSSTRSFSLLKSRQTSKLPLSFLKRPLKTWFQTFCLVSTYISWYFASNISFSIE